MPDREFFKILMFMKRRSDLSVQAFREYYENHHVPLCLQYSSGISHYIRRFINPQPHPETGQWDNPEFDVITELWFDDKALFESTLAYITSTVMPEAIINDEKNLFDRKSFRLATVTEYSNSP